MFVLRPKGKKILYDVVPIEIECSGEIIRKFPQIQTVDLTGGAPEMLYGFKRLAEAARATGKEVIVRSNLTIYFENACNVVTN